MRNPGQIIPDHAAVLATLARSVPADPGAVAAVAPGTVVRTSGRARPGPSGMLHAPLSGRPCVWYRAVQVQYRRFGALDWQTTPITPSFPPVLGSDAGYTMGDSLADDESSAPFEIAGAGGAVLVDPARGDVDAAVVSHDSSEGRYAFAPYVMRREWIVEADAPVFALGVTAPGGGRPVLRSDPQNCLVVSTRGEQAAVQRAQGAVAAAPIVADLRRRVAIVMTVVGVVVAAIMVVVVLSVLG